MTCISPEQVNQAFIANAPLISDTIKNMTLQSPNWFRDIYTATPWPVGEGTLMQEFKFRGELPQIEEGFESWNLLDNPAGCGPVCTPNCSYNMHTLGGHAFETKITRLMQKDFRTPDYCVKSIQNTRQYDQVFKAIVQNMYNQISFQKEINVGQNFMRMIAKKLVIDSGGFKPNSEDPYSYRAKGTATLSMLTVDGMKFLYQVIRRMPDALPYAYNNGMPTYALVASDELISDLQRNDPSIRADLRAAAAGNSQMGMDLVNKYNFTTTFRDMFFPVPYLYPARFRWDGAKGWVRVLPWAKGVKGEAGTFTDINPLYIDPSYATHEEVLIHGANPFSVYYQPTVTTLGEGSDFGPETGFWDVFDWINPQTRDDPARREGFYFTSATIGMSADHSESVMAVLVPRAPVSTMIGFYPSAACPPEAEVCTNVVPDVACPTPIILSLTPNPVVAGQYFVKFAAPVAAIANDIIQLQHQNGGYVNATVVAVTGDSKTFSVTISGTLPDCDRFVSVYSGDSLGCKARVEHYSVDLADATRLDLILDRPIKADTAADVVTLTYGNGTQVSATVIGTPNMLTNAWKVDIGSSAFANNVGGVVEICVPTATDATCDGCSTSLTTSAQCS